jgi:adenosylcobinamide-GDP ribazoletransferase
MRTALAFLTPFGRATRPDPGTLSWFPVVGAGIGLVLGGAWWAADRVWPASVAAAVVVVADLALTGLLHIDGLADSADGLLAPMSRARRLEVMADPTTGAFGVATVATVLLLRYASLASIAASPLLLAGVWCASRTWMAVIARARPYARGEGLVTAFLGRTPWLVGGVGVVLSTGLVLAGSGHFVHRWIAVVALAAGALAAALVTVLADRRIGGFTGDVLGAAGVMSETIALLVLAARR